MEDISLNSTHRIRDEQYLKGFPTASSGVPTRAEEWIAQLPWRWSKAAAFAGLVASGFFVVVQPPPELYLGVSVVFIVAAQAALCWLLIGLWARWSLRVKLEQSVEAALAAIQDNWLSGAAILAGGPIVLRRLLIELDLYPFGRPSEADDFFAAIIAFPTLMGGAFLLSMISRRALARRI
jgi:hypothetical protein